MTIAELIKHLQQYEPDSPVAASIWLAEDVEGRARELGVALTEDQPAYVLAEVHYGHDANYGISWDTLDHYILNLAEEEAD